MFRLQKATHREVPERPDSGCIPSRATVRANGAFAFAEWQGEDVGEHGTSATGRGTVLAAAVCPFRTSVTPSGTRRRVGDVD